MYGRFRCGREVAVARSQVDSTSQLLSAVSGGATIGGCGRASAAFIKDLDRSSSRKAGVQYP